MAASCCELFPWRLMAMGSASLSRSMAYWKLPFLYFKSATSTNNHLIWSLLFSFFLYLLISFIFYWICCERGVKFYGFFIYWNFIYFCHIYDGFFTSFSIISTYFSILAFFYFSNYSFFLCSLSRVSCLLSISFSHNFYWSSLTSLFAYFYWEYGAFNSSF